MGTGITQGINDITIYAEKKCYRNFTDFGKKFSIKKVSIIMVIIVIYLLMVGKN